MGLTAYTCNRATHRQKQEDRLFKTTLDTVRQTLSQKQKQKYQKQGRGERSGLGYALNGRTFALHS
jgi:hypothetical protein